MWRVVDILKIIPIKYNMLNKKYEHVVGGTRT